MQLSRSQLLSGTNRSCLQTSRCVGARQPLSWRVRRKPNVKALKSGSNSSSSNSTDDAQNISEVITFITSDGLVRLPRWQTSTPFQAAKAKRRLPLPTWQEQGLCIGNTFWVTATNGLDICRRLNLMGYCRCTEMLSDVVEHSVLSSGGEIIIREHKSSSSMHESLHMTVAIPFLWGVPPRHESLSTAIISGGGYVEKVYRQWEMYGK